MVFSYVWSGSEHEKQGQGLRLRDVLPLLHSSHGHDHSCGYSLPWSSSGAEVTGLCIPSQSGLISDLNKLIAEGRLPRETVMNLCGRGQSYQEIHTLSSLYSRKP